MGAVICGSGKSAGHERCSGKQTGKSLRRKITKDSIYDSSDFIECSSLIHTNRKEKIKLTNKCDVHSSISEQLETKELKVTPCTVENCPCLLCQKKESSLKHTSTQRLFRHVFSRKHKTYSSESTQSLRKVSSINQSTTILEPVSSYNEKLTYAESVTQTNSISVEDRSTSTLTCVDHFASLLLKDGNCGLCDFIHSGEHSMWDSLDTDVIVFQEITRNLSKWLSGSPKCINKIILQKMEPRRKVRIVLKRNNSGFQEILITDGNSSYQIQECTTSFRNGNSINLLYPLLYLRSFA